MHNILYYSSSNSLYTSVVHMFVHTLLFCVCVALLKRRTSQRGVWYPSLTAFTNSVHTCQQHQLQVSNTHTNTHTHPHTYTGNILWTNCPWKYPWEVWKEIFFCSATINTDRSLCKLWKGFLSAKQWRWNFFETLLYLISRIRLHKVIWLQNCKEQNGDTTVAAWSGVLKQTLGRA